MKKRANNAAAEKGFNELVAERHGLINMEESDMEKIADLHIKSLSDEFNNLQFITEFNGLARDIIDLLNRVNHNHMYIIKLLNAIQKFFPQLKSEFNKPSINLATGDALDIGIKDKYKLVVVDPKLITYIVVYPYVILNINQYNQKITENIQEQKKIKSELEDKLKLSEDKSVQYRTLYDKLAQSLRLFGITINHVEMKGGKRTKKKKKQKRTKKKSKKSKK